MAKEKTKEIAKREPSRVLAPLDEAEKWFEDLFKRPFPFMPSLLSRWRMPEMEEIVPSIDMFEEKDSVVIKAELPGMKKEDIDISLTDNTITLSGEDDNSSQAINMFLDSCACPGRDPGFAGMTMA